MDGSLDSRMSPGLQDLVGAEYVDFRRQLLERPPPKTIDALVRSLFPTEGVKVKKTSTAARSTPPDEGTELLDQDETETAEDEQLDDQEQLQEEQPEDENEPTLSETFADLSFSVWVVPGTVRHLSSAFRGARHTSYSNYNSTTVSPNSHHSINFDHSFHPTHTLIHDHSLSIHIASH